MNIEILYHKALALEFLSKEEALFLYQKATLTELMFVANEMRKKLVPHEKVTWIIDRNINTTNVCIANCKFCNFYRIPGHVESYITDMDTYKQKIEETFKYGGEQLLLQGGHHPELGLDYYTNLFKELKKLYPTLKLHALGPPEIAHICKVSKVSHKEAIKALIEAGLDSLPGPGAEILVDRVRKIISTGKCNAEEWLTIMHEAHLQGLTTTATMMFGHIETLEERFEHLIKIREIQVRKPPEATGFIAFIPWTFQSDGTLLEKQKKAPEKITSEEYIRMIALSRIVLPNIKNIQASWLTVGKQTAQLCLHAGANDWGSIMIEENVVSVAGATHRFTYSNMQKSIFEAGFIPQLRNQQYEFSAIPSNIQEQVIQY
ncbi:MAG: cyclic dehypoxanthinyl futalosine synthase [Chitinophagaceae bacterium]